MQKWEYLLLLSRYDNNDRKYYYAIIGDNSEVENNLSDPLQMMNHLGEQGWELVAAQYEPPLLTSTLTFKRHLQSPKSS